MSGAERDPAGHYAFLGLTPEASAAEITTAYRAVAKRLHPDVPITGNRAAFLRLQEAYQVLGDPLRRAEYDTPPRADEPPRWRQEEDALPFVPAVSWRLPPYIGMITLVITVLAVVQAGFYVFTSSRAFRGVDRALAMAAQPAAPPPATAPGLATFAPTRLDAATGDHFLGPSPRPVTVWQRRPDRSGYYPAGELPAFSVVQLVQPAGDDGFAEIRSQPGETAFVEAVRLQPGDTRAARRAACLYSAGAPPRSGSLLTRPAGGPVRVTVENREERPAVFKLRDARDGVAAAVYLGPRGRAAIEQLPAGLYRAEFAVGDVWAAACGMFMAGMRAQRLPDKQDLSGPASFSISAATVAEDISDDAFSHE